jgi:hypothetical protein
MEIGKVKVLLTILEGKEVYRSPLFPSLEQHIIEDGAARQVSERSSINLLHQTFW